MSSDLAALVGSVPRLSISGLFDPNDLLVSQVSRDFAEVWRGRLAKSDLAVTSAIVSDSMSQILAAQGTAVSDAFAQIATRLPATEIGLASFEGDLDRLRGLAGVDAVTQAAAARAADTFGFLREALRPVALAATINWAEHLSGIEEENQRDEAALRRYGWSMAPSWTFTDMLDAADVARTEGKRAVDREICGWYKFNRSRLLREMVEEWMGDAAFRSRRPIIRDAVKDHSQGRFRVSIPTLLPMIEGIAFEVFDPELMIQTTNPRTPIRSAIESYERRDLLADAMLNALTVLWARVPFGSAPPMSRMLNRHLILHGRTLRYGTEANSLKVFLALDHIHSTVRTKRDHDRAAA